jgi:hypothetical protein
LQVRSDGSCERAGEDLCAFQREAASAGAHRIGQRHLHPRDQRRGVEAREEVLQVAESVLLQAFERAVLAGGSGLDTPADRALLVVDGQGELLAGQRGPAPPDPPSSTARTLRSPNQ